MSEVVEIIARAFRMKIDRSHEHWGKMPSTIKTEAVLSALKEAGLVIVPREPTAAMVAAGQRVVKDGPALGGPAFVLVTTQTFDTVYRAMIAAAEKQP